MSPLISPTIAITLSCLATHDPVSNRRIPHLAGIGLFRLAEPSPGEIDFGIAVRAVPEASNANDALLLRWLADQLEDPATLVGWRLADSIVPALIAASTNASPREDRVFVDALARSVGIGAVDLADRFGGAAAPAFHAICAGGSIATIAPAAEMLATTGEQRTLAITPMLAANVTATMRLWANAMPPRADTLHRLADDALHAWRAAAAATASV